jgi:hypothetical protein
MNEYILNKPLTNPVEKCIYKEKRINARSEQLIGT